MTLPSSIQQQQQDISNSRRRHTAQSVDTNNDATSTIQWYDSDGSTLLVDFPHNHDDGDQSADDGYTNQPCTDTHNLPHNDTAINIRSSNSSSNSNIYDKHGRCIHHPQIQLRRRQLFSFSTEWKTILKVCPDCCMEELNRLYASTSSIKKVKEHGKKEEENGLDETELYDGDSTDDEEEDSSSRR